ncbi:MAG: 5,10-methylenetetrahydromethanopterin reductase [Halobacteriales archaeon]|jgi:5,10-methylenetetrahydromethanopterin reductase
MLGIELSLERPIAEAVDLAGMAEEEGFDAVLGSCHYNNRDPFVAASRIAAATETVRVGPAAANPYETHPVALAARVATLDEVSHGRALFGLGPGDRSTLANLVVEQDRPLRRVLETMQVARRLFDGERVEHNGTFDAVDAGLNFQPGRIPIYVGAQGPHMLRMAAKYADGVLLNAAHPDDVAWAAERVEEGVEERDPDRDNPEFVVYAGVSVAEDAAGARRVARQPVAFVVGGAAAPVLDRHGIDRDRAKEIGAAVEAGDFEDAFDLVTPAMLDAFAVAGTPPEVADRFDALLEYADGIVVGSPLGPAPATAVRLAGAAVDRSTRVERDR